MAERVVDGLEVVEIEIVHRQRLPAPDRAQRLREPLAQTQAVGQIRQRIVMRHVRDLLFGLAPLGDVFVGRDPADAGHDAVGDRDGAAVADFDDRLRICPDANSASMSAAYFVRIAAKMFRCARDCAAVR